MSTNNIIAAATEELVQQAERALEFKAELVAGNQSRLLSAIAVERDGQAWRVELGDLRILPDFNIRIKDASYYAHVEYLANSIIENGYYPESSISGYLGLEGKKLVIYVTDGHCRIEGVKLAIERGALIKDLPLVLKDKSTTMEDLTVGLAQSAGGKPLRPIELSIIVKRLENFGWKPDKIAKRLCISPEYVGQLLTIAGAPQSMRESIESNDTSLAVGLYYIRNFGSDAPAAMRKAIEAVKAQGKKKLTFKDVPIQTLKKAQVKSAPAMFDAISKVKSDGAFQHLSEEVQRIITGVLDQIAKEDAKAKLKADAKAKANAEEKSESSESQAST